MFTDILIRASNTVQMLANATTAAELEAARAERAAIIAAWPLKGRFSRIGLEAHRDGRS